MRRLVKVVYILGLLFWGSFLIYAVAKLIVYNGLGKHYEFVCGAADSLKIEEMPNYLRVTYSYETKNGLYKKTEEVSNEFFHEQVAGIPTELTVCYNSTYPKLSYIKDANLSIVQARTGVVIASIFIAFISILYIFGQRDYWILKYKTFFDK